jgi:hypothetical protein
MENTAKLGLFAVHKIVSEYGGKNLCIHGEDAKRHKTLNISFNNNMNFNFFKIIPKNHLTLLSLLNVSWLQPKNIKKTI